ncbi:MAG: ATP-grasp domain-containing protein [Acidimicrobiia bacterium]
MVVARLGAPTHQLGQRSCGGGVNGAPRETTLIFVEANTTGTGRLFAAAARRHGFRPVVLTAAQGRYPWAATDGVDVVGADTEDPAAVARAALVSAGRGGLAGIWTTSEYFVDRTATAAARLGLPGPDPEAVRRCRDKGRQRLALAEAGVPIPRFALASSVAEALGGAQRVGYPVVGKPIDGSGSRGVRLLADAAAVEAHARFLLAGGPDERGRPCAARLLVEEYVDGQEVSVETFGTGEPGVSPETTVVAVTDKQVGPLPTFVEYGHDLPSTLPRDQRVAAGTLAKRALRALGLEWGPAHTEIRFTADGPVVVEVNPRLAGGLIPVALRLATGVDLIGATVGLVTGAAPVLPPAGGGSAAIRFLVADQPRRIRAVSGVAAAWSTPGVVDVSVAARPGLVAGGTGCFLDRLGHVIAVAPTPQAASLAAERARSCLVVEVEAAA